MSSALEFRGDIELLGRLSTDWAGSGYETPVCDIVVEECQKLKIVDRMYVDDMGNLHVVVEGTSDQARGVLIPCHMDGVSLRVSEITPNGFLGMIRIAGIDPSALVARDVVVSSDKNDLVPGVILGRPTHTLGEDGRNVTPISRLFVNLGARSAEEVKQLGIRPGCMVCLTGDFIPSFGPHKLIVGPTLDNRVGVFSAIELLKRLEKNGRPEHRVIVVFTVQEEIQTRGAAVAPFEHDFDITLCFDTVLADTPGFDSSKHPTVLGNGVAIEAMDSTVLCNPKLVDLCIRQAEALDIRYQVVVLPMNGTDAGAIERANRPVASMALRIPTRGSHSPREMVDPSDVEGLIRLGLRLVENLGEALTLLPGRRIK